MPIIKRKLVRAGGERAGARGKFNLNDSPACAQLSERGEVGGDKFQGNFVFIQQREQITF